MNNRRKLVIAMGAGTLGAPLACFAQQAKELPRIGYLLSQIPSPDFDAFRRHMRDLGYTDGSNIVYERRTHEGQLDRIPVMVRELVQQKVHVLVLTNNVAIQAARKATATIPIVMMSSIDPVAAGYIAALARPGGNITGISILQHELDAKRIETLREAFPKLSRLAILWDEDGPAPKIAFKNYETAAQALKLRVQSIAIRGPKPDLEGAFLAAKTGGAEAIIVVTNPMMGVHRATIMALSLKHRLPLMAEREDYADAGALMSYGANLRDMPQRMAVYVDKILKGAKPADLPIEQPTKFDLAINMKTAKALGITIPQSVLLRADRVIE